VLSIAAVAVMLHRPAAAHRARPTAVSSAAPPSPATVTSSAATGWTTYRDPEGFSIKIPPGWAIHTRTATEVTFTGPQAGFVVLVGWTTHPRPDALADWRQQAALKTQSDPTYQQIGIQRVTYRGYNTADWEFTNMYHGQLTHVLDRASSSRPAASATPSNCTARTPAGLRCARASGKDCCRPSSPAADASRTQPAQG
jgi:hypothetical protein